MMLKLSQLYLLQPTLQENVCLVQVVCRKEKLVWLEIKYICSSVVHATEIHLCSLTGARTCMRV